MDVNREKALDLAVSQIERQFGKGAIMKLGEGGIVKDVPDSLDWFSRARYCFGDRWCPARPRHRDLWTGSLG